MSKIKILLVILIGFSLPLYVTWKTISVNFLYSSLGDPQSGIKITVQEISGKKIIVFPEEENYFFNKAKLELLTKKDSLGETPIKIRAYQNFIANLYPIEKDQILDKQSLERLLFENNSTDIPIGSLFSDGDAVKILSQGNSYRTIFSAELLEKMNYKWEDVMKKPIGFSGDLTENAIFNYGNPHPDGTFLESDSDIFLVWKQKLIKLDSEIDIKKISKTLPIIKITSESPEAFDECEAEIKNLKITCDFEKITPNQKSNYIFELEDLDLDSVDEISLKLSTSLSKSSLLNNLKTSIGNIKLKLIKTYRGYIPFI